LLITAATRKSLSNNEADVTLMSVVGRRSNVPFPDTGTHCTVQYS
jgi:hypothetical protein